MEPENDRGLGFELPDEAGIVRIYQRLRDRSGALDAEQVERFRSAKSAMWGSALDVVLHLAVLIAVMNTFAEFWGSLLVPFGFIIGSGILHKRRETAGTAKPEAILLAFGPFGAIVLAVALARWRRERASEAKPIDPTSLSVVEPVTRHLAEPILESARAITIGLAQRSDDGTLERLAARRDELRAQAVRETDPVWSAAASEQADRLEAQHAALELQNEREMESRRRILADAAELRAYLDRLTERRRLLEEMSASRAPLPDEIVRSEGEEVRARLAALAGSLRDQEGLARERVAAELEMNALERSVAEGK